MLGSTKSYTLLASAICLLICCAQNNLCQDTGEHILNGKVRRLELSDANLHLALSKIASAYNTPIGLEVAKGGSRGPQIKLNVQNASLRDVLIALIAQDSWYKWTVVDGVINVFPIADRDEFVEQLLKIHVQQFDIKAGTGIWDIRASITNLPEVKASLESAKLIPSIASFTGADYLEASPGFTLNLSGATVREILNEIIRRSDTKYWVVNRFGDNNELLTINFSSAKSRRT
jgi:hypothetical protein